MFVFYNRLHSILARSTEPISESYVRDIDGAITSDISGLLQPTESLQILRRSKEGLCAYTLKDSFPSLQLQTLG